MKVSSVQIGYPFTSRACAKVVGRSLQPNTIAGTSAVTQAETTPVQIGMSLDGRTMRIRFVPCGDRLRHIVEVLVGEKIYTLFESVEGDSTDEWPPSPPLQDGDITSRDDWTRIALLVGMAGASHWSMSVELAPAGDELCFDAACRHATAPGRLLSSYRLGYDVSARDEGDRLTLTIGDQAFTLAAEDVEGQTARLACENYDLAVHAPESEDASATVQWRYRLTRIDHGAA